MEKFQSFNAKHTQWEGGCALWLLIFFFSVIRIPKCILCIFYTEQERNNNIIIVLFTLSFFLSSLVLAFFLGAVCNFFYKADIAYEMRWLNRFICTPHSTHTPKLNIIGYRSAKFVIIFIIFSFRFCCSFETNRSILFSFTSSCLSLSISWYSKAKQNLLCLNTYSFWRSIAHFG